MHFSQDRYILANVIEAIDTVVRLNPEHGIAQQKRAEYVTNSKHTSSAMIPINDVFASVVLLPIIYK